MKPVQRYQICSVFRLQNDEVQDFDTRWDQAPLAAMNKIMFEILKHRVGHRSYAAAMWDQGGYTASLGI